MPRYDLPDRAGPVTVTLSRDHRDRDMSLPHTTDDPHEIKRLMDFGCVESLPPAKTPENAADVMAHTKPRKEVTE